MSSGQGGARRHSARFYENRECEHFPCHETGGAGLNCLFCYCPLYFGSCPGRAGAVRVGSADVKDCSRCDFPHRPENYESVLEHLRRMLRGGG